MAETSVTKVIADILNNPLEGGAKKRNPDLKIRDGLKFSGGLDLSEANELIAGRFTGGISVGEMLGPAGGASGSSCGLRGGAELSAAAADTAAAAEAVVDAVPPVEGGAKRKLHPMMVLFNKIKNEYVKELKKKHPTWNGAQIQKKAMMMAKKDYDKMKRSKRLGGGDSE